MDETTYIRILSHLIWFYVGFNRQKLWLIPSKGKKEWADTTLRAIGYDSYSGQNRQG